MKSQLARSVLFSHLERRGRDEADRVAIHSVPERRSYRFPELVERIAAWAGVLRRAGVEEGQTVALATGNCPAFIELFFALRLLDAPVLLLDEPAAAIAPKMGASWVLQRIAEGTAPAGAPDPALRIRAAQPELRVPAGTALIKLTSGSTMAPRGACFTEEALVE